MIYVQNFQIVFVATLLEIFEIYNNNVKMCLSGSGSDMTFLNSDWSIFNSRYIMRTANWSMNDKNTLRILHCFRLFGESKLKTKSQITMRFNGDGGFSRFRWDFEGKLDHISLGIEAKYAHRLIFVASWGRQVEHLLL